MMGLANDFIDANLIIHQRTQGTDEPTVEENDAGHASFAHYQNSTVKKFSQPILKDRAGHVTAMTNAACIVSMILCNDPVITVQIAMVRT